MGKNQRTQKTQAQFRDQAREEENKFPQKTSKDYWPTPSAAVEETLDQVDKTMKKDIHEEKVSLLKPNIINDDGDTEKFPYEPKKKLDVESANRPKRRKRYYKKEKA